MGHSQLPDMLGECSAHGENVHIVQDMARVARWMAGKAVGLVLSGGGSRGLAHLGVLHALDDAGVPIDVIGGTSQVGTLPGPSDCMQIRRDHSQNSFRLFHLSRAAW